MFKITKIMGVFIIVVCVLVSVDMVIQWGQSLDQINRWLDVVLYSLIAVVLVNYLVLPWLAWASKPKIGDLKEALNTDDKMCLRLAKRIVKSNKSNDEIKDLTIVTTNKDYDLIRKHLKTYYEQNLTEIEKFVGESGKRVFSLTALSQNSLIDGLIILVINLNMLYRIYEKLGLRESYVEIFKFYNNTFMQASFMSLLEEFDDELLDVLQSKSTELLKKIPFADVLLASILQGVANGYATSYYGYLTISNFRREIFNIEEGSVRKYARKKARENILDIAKKSINTLGDYSKKKVRSFSWKKDDEEKTVDFD